MKHTSRRALVAHLCALTLGVACDGQGADTEHELADSGTTAIPSAGETNDVVTPPRPPFDVDPSVNPAVEPSVEPDVDPEVEPSVEPEVDPEVEPEVDPEVEPSTEVDPEVEPSADPEVEPEPLEPSVPVAPTAPLPAGNINGACEVPLEARADDTSSPDHVIGDGTPQSCTGERVIEAVAQGGVITFACGPDPVTITLDRPAKVFNDTGPKIVIDGGGLVTLSGAGQNRILYMNTCDEAQRWTTAHCQDQDHPQLTVQNLTFVNGNSKAEAEYDGGGAIWVRGGRFKIVNSRFFSNVCADVGPDVGGGAVRAFSQYQGQPVYVVASTFGGSPEQANVCSNGGALSSIDVSWTILNSEFSHNRAVGNGGNPAADGTPGGGSGGAIYNDGNTMTLSVCGSNIHHNEVNAFGSAIFFVSNDHSGEVRIDDSTITENIGGSWYPTYPQISNHDDTPIHLTNSTIQ